MTTGQLEQLSAADIALLDNPIWSALSSEHAELALGGEHARRYPPEIGPLSGIPEEAEDCFEALRALTAPAGVVVLFLLSPPQPRAGWTLIRGGLVDQMVCASPEKYRRFTAAAPETHGAAMRRLTANDAPAMVELAELTEPGPFRLRTMELGTFYGIEQEGRLLGMAGKRMHVPGYVEVSGVCTHPDARGRSYAGLLMSKVMDEIFAEGRTPFLHTYTDNVPAIRVYQKLGFVRRQTFHLAVLKNQG